MQHKSTLQPCVKQYAAASLSRRHGRPGATASGDTGELDRKQLMSLMTQVVDPAIARKLRVHSRECLAMRPIGRWHPHWVDHLHEPDGGEDTIGCNRLGVEELRKHMDALYSRNGSPEAWDDMNDVFLDPQAVEIARLEEMRFF